MSGVGRRVEIKNDTSPVSCTRVTVTRLLQSNIQLRARMALFIVISMHC